ncbi:18685_t:CDS:2, partial [Funneliformis geosporum]
MERKELEKLAQKVQLEIKESELSFCLETFSHLEKLLTNFKKEKVGKRIKPMARINVGHLTLKDLNRLKKKFTQSRISKEVQVKNSLNTDDGFGGVAERLKAVVLKTTNTFVFKGIALFHLIFITLFCTLPHELGHAIVANCFSRKLFKYEIRFGKLPLIGGSTHHSGGSE